MKKFIRIFCMALAVLSIVGTFSVYNFPEEVMADDDTDFASNEDYYYTLCSSKGLTDEQKTTCSDFREYVNNQLDDLEAQVKNSENEIASIKKNISSQGAKITEYSQKVDELEARINTIENSITTIEGNIADLEAEIEVKEVSIEEKNETIKKRMVVNQSRVSLNSYIEFIMGASDFVDLLRRISTVNQITQYDLDAIHQLEEEKTELEEDQEELVYQKELLEEQKNNLQSNMDAYNTLIIEAQELIAQYQKDQEALVEQMMEMEQDISDMNDHLDEINMALSGFYASSGFSHFYKTSFQVTTQPFYYSGGGFHPAIDAATTAGTPAYAIANGIVVAAKSGCSYGYLGNYCNGGRGNYVVYIIQVNNACYAVANFHFSSVAVSVGDTVYGGRTVVGYEGSTGNSTGPHLHIEMIYLGNISMTEAINWYKQTSGGFSMSYNYSATCPYRGNKAPCYVALQDIYGIYVGHWYSW